VTSQLIQQLADGVEKYRNQMGSLPTANDIGALTDTLHPRYMKDLVREDGWGHSILYEVMGTTTFKLTSLGADGRPGTADDIVFEKQSTAP
jgi:hypothetical protein